MTADDLLDELERLVVLIPEAKIPTALRLLERLCDMPPDIKPVCRDLLVRQALD